MSSWTEEYGSAQKAFLAAQGAGGDAIRSAASRLDQLAEAVGVWESRRSALAGINIDSSMMGAEARAQQDRMLCAHRAERELAKVQDSLGALQKACTSMLRAAEAARAEAQRHWDQEDADSHAECAALATECAAMYHTEVILKEAIANRLTLETPGKTFNELQIAWSYLPYVEDAQCRRLEEAIRAISEQHMEAEPAGGSKSSKKKKKNKAPAAQ